MIPNTIDKGQVIQPWNFSEDARPEDPDPLDFLATEGSDQPRGNYDDALKDYQSKLELFESILKSIEK